jgi:hypothetical protein
VVAFIGAVSCPNACCINWLVTSNKNGASKAKNTIPDKIALVEDCRLFIDTTDFTFNLSLSSIFLVRSTYLQKFGYREVNHSHMQILLLVALFALLNSYRN